MRLQFTGESESSILVLVEPIATGLGSSSLPANGSVAVEFQSLEYHQVDLNNQSKAFRE